MSYLLPAATSLPTSNGPLFGNSSDKASNEEPKNGKIFGTYTNPSPAQPKDTSGLLAFGAKEFQGFGDLAKNVGSNGFMFGNTQKENKGPIFGQTSAVSQLFGGSKPSALFGSQQQAPKVAAEGGEDGEGDEGNANPEEYEPQVDFKPLVVLKEVEVKTGEEDEEVLFKERCKLFRFAAEKKEWKEKGVGEIKILRHKITNVHRVLMRRDQVLKLCANHRILPEIKLEIANEKQVRWSTNDYSENDGKYEVLTAKFRHEDEAKRFKAEFEKAQGQHVASSNSPVKVVTNSLSSLGFSMRVEEGTWSCSQCLVRNKPDTNICACCGLLRFGEADKNDGL